MALRQRVFKHTDAPMTWTKAIILGFLIWVFLILFTGQLPSWIIYKVDQSIGSLIEWSKNIPGVNKDGLNTAQIKIIRDIVANSVQMGIFTGFLIAAYIWQEKKRKRIGGKGLQDPVKGYMPGK